MGEAAPMIIRGCMLVGLSKERPIWLYAVRPSAAWCVYGRCICSHMFSSRVDDEFSSGFQVIISTLKGLPQRAGVGGAPYVILLHHVAEKRIQRRFVHGRLSAYAWIRCREAKAVHLHITSITKHYSHCHACSLSDSHAQGRSLWWVLFFASVSHIL